MVYALPENLAGVLKVAMNPKGIMQIENEGQHWLTQYHGDVIAHLLETDEEEHTWLMMERTRKITENEFKAYFNATPDEVREASARYSNPERAPYRKQELPDKIREMFEDERIQSLGQLIENLEMGSCTGDLTRIANWGRRANGDIVLHDYGITQCGYETHYMKKKASLYESNEEPAPEWPCKCTPPTDYPHPMPTPKTRTLHPAELISELLDPQTMGLRKGELYGTGTPFNVNQVSSNLGLPNARGDGYKMTSSHPYSIDPSRAGYPTQLGEDGDEVPPAAELVTHSVEGENTPVSATLGAPLRMLFIALQKLPDSTRAAACKLVGQAILAMTDPEANVAALEEDAEDMPPVQIAPPHSPIQ